MRGTQFAQLSVFIAVAEQRSFRGATLNAGETIGYALGERRRGYLVPAIGTVEINGARIDARDGAVIKDVVVVRITAVADLELVMVDTL